ncbi:MAG: hypothetical protein WCS42_03625 [Verrucomicrobiota bacterium]
MKKESAKMEPLTPEQIQEVIAKAGALIESLEPHLAEGAHLITALGAVRTTVANLENHIGALTAKAAQPAAE